MVITIQGAPLTLDNSWEAQEAAATAAAADEPIF